MTQYTNPEFKVQTATLFPTNGVGAISAADIRAQFDNLADSAPFKTTGMAAAPTVNDDGANTSGNGVFVVGDFWVDETNDVTYVCQDVSTGAAVWTSITGAGSGTIEVQDESSTTVAAASVIDFQGSAVTVTDVSGVATVTITGGSGVTTAGDLGFALTGNPVDGDDGAVLALLLDTILDNGYSPVKIQFVQDNITAQNLQMYINSTVDIPSYVEIDFGMMTLVYGATARIRMSGSESEINPGSRITPTPTTGTGRLESAISAGATTLELRNGDPESDPTLYNVGEYIILRGEQDAGGVAIEKDIVRITNVDVPTRIITFTPATEFAYAVDYPGSSSPFPGLDETTITIRQSYPIERSNAATGDTVINVGATAAADLAPGDWIQIEDDKTIGDENDDTTSSNAVRFEMVQITDVDTTGGSENITISRALLDTFTLANNSIVTKILPCQFSTIKNANVTFAESQTDRNFHIAHAVDSVQCTIDNIHVRRDWSGGFTQLANAHRLLRSVQCNILNCSTRNPEPTVGGAESYGLSLYYTYGCTVNNYYAHGTRHSLLLFGADRNIVTNFVSTDCAVSDIDFHGGNERENIISNFTIVGGVTQSSDSTSKTGVKFGNPFHLAGCFGNVVQNGTIVLPDDGLTTQRGIEIQAPSSDNVISNIRIRDVDTAIYMVDQGRSSDASGSDNDIFSSNNIIQDIKIDDCRDWAIRFDSSNSGATNRVVNNTTLRGIEMRNCDKFINVVQTDRVILEDITMHGVPTGAVAYGIDLDDNTNFVAKNIKFINGDRGIRMLDCPDAVIDDVLFDLTGTIALLDSGSNNGASVTNMKFRGTTATHDFTGASTYRALTNAERGLFSKTLAGISTKTDFTTVLASDDSIPLVSEGTEVVSVSYTPTVPSTTLEVEAVFPYVTTDAANTRFFVTLFDGSTCIAVESQQIDTSGLSSGRSIKIKAHVQTTDYTAKTFSARIAINDGDTGDTLSIGDRLGQLDDPYITVVDLGSI